MLFLLQDHIGDRIIGVSTKMCCISYNCLLSTQLYTCCGEKSKEVHSTNCGQKQSVYIFILVVQLYAIIVPTPVDDNAI